MTTIDTVVIGAGHAGLAVSRLLTDAGRDHVVLDRGRVAERWRTERWDSLHLLTPELDDPAARAGRTAGPTPTASCPPASSSRHLEAYAASFGAPVLDRHDGAEQVAAPARRRATASSPTAAPGSTANVVIATGPHGVAARARPAWRPRRRSLTADRLPQPGAAPAGGVLVVGASSSGVQIADELNRAGREVVLAVGRHTRMPRTLPRHGHLLVAGAHRPARPHDRRRARPGRRAARAVAAAGRPRRAERSDAHDLDLVALQARGVRLAGRFAGRHRPDERAFRPRPGRTPSRPPTGRMHRFLDAVDDYVDAAGLAVEVWPAERPAAARACRRRPLGSTCAPSGIGTVLVATGYRPHHPWLRLPVIDAGRRIRQHRGVTPAPGVYVVGQRFQHRRDSGFIDGARHDARAVVQHLLTRSNGRRALEALDEETAA